MTTKTITLDIHSWEMIARALKSYNDQGSQRGESWDSEELQLVKMRFMLALRDTKAIEVKEE